MKLPEAFREKYTTLFGDEANAFFQALSEKPVKSFWVNSLKTTPAVLLSLLEKQSWKCKQAFHVNAFEIVQGPVKPAHTKEFKHGLYNMQDLSSMLPALVLAPSPKDAVLDAAAAPGNKTLQLACLMKNEGMLTAVDEDRKRMQFLLGTIRKFGITNTEAVRSNLLSFRSPLPFDKILLDAPCSNEGLFSKDKEVIKRWSMKNIKRKAKLQKRLLKKAATFLKVKGTLVYSTCTIAPEENELVITHFLDNHPEFALQDIEIKNFPLRSGFKEIEGHSFHTDITKTKRVYPQDTQSEAFFLAKLVKKK